MAERLKRRPPPLSAHAVPSSRPRVSLPHWPTLAADASAARQSRLESGERPWRENGRWQRRWLWAAQWGAPSHGWFPLAGGMPPSGVIGGGASATNLQVNAHLVAHLEAHTTDGSFRFATTNSTTASPYIIATGKPVIALGGFTGSEPILTLAQLQTLVVNGTMRCFLLSGGGGRPGGSSSATAWVTNACSVVPMSEWSGSGSASSGGQEGSQQSYDCAGKA